MTRTNHDPLAVQLLLQQDSFANDPPLMNPEEKADFFTWNFVALVTELGEASDEIGWKPWATSRHLNRDEYLGELVDAFHFFLNMVLMGTSDWDEFMAIYLKKVSVNRQRQEVGYDGVSGKCPFCHRDIATTPALHTYHPDGSLHCVPTQQCVTEAAVKASVLNRNEPAPADAIHTASDAINLLSGRPTRIKDNPQA